MYKDKPKLSETEGLTSVSYCFLESPLSHVWSTHHHLSIYTDSH